MQIRRHDDLAPEYLSCKVIAGVMRNAQCGDIPLFSWTLGLPQDDLLRIIRASFPELGVLEPMSGEKYAILLRSKPPLFEELAMFLNHHAADAQQASWLARAIAAAAMGECHLWQDAGLSNSNELSALLKIFFPGLHAANTKQFKWKRFLFLALGETLGMSDLYPPGCRKCEQVALCFRLHNKQEQDHDGR